MDNQIREYLNLLRDNIVVVKRYERPDWFDGTDNLSELETSKLKLFNEKEYHPATLDSKMHADEVVFSNLIKRFELNGYQNDSEFEEFLISQFEKFKNIFVKDNLWNQSEVKAEVANHLRKTRSELDHLLLSGRNLKDTRFNSLIKVKTDVCVETIRFINFPLPVLAQINQKSAKSSKNKKQFENLTSLTQNQIVILFHFLRKHKYLGNEMPKNEYAQHLAELTGFAAEKIRQDLSHIDSNPDSTNTVKFSEYDYMQVKRTLRHIIKDIDESFPS